ncbi:MAG: replication initiation protein [Salinibacter sp.]
MSKQLSLMHSGPEEELVVKANELVTSQLDLTTREYRVFLAHVSQIDQEAENVKGLSINMKRLCELSDVKTENIYSEVEEMADRLTKKRIHVEKGPTGKRVGGYFNLYSACEYKEETGEIIGSFTDQMKPLLLQLREHFTMYYRRRAMSMRSTYAMRFYEILKRYEYQGAFTLSVEKLRKIFSIEDSYDRFGDLKRYVINKAQAELEKRAEINFEYEVIREGQKPVRVDFEIQKASEAPAPPPKKFRSERSEHYQRYDSLPEEEKKKIYSKAKGLAEEQNPTAGRRVIEAETWRFVKQIMRNEAEREQ